MAIKRFIATKDTTITNAFKSNLRVRASGSNMGASDSLEVFSIYGQSLETDTTAKTVELSRILLEFPMSEISASRESGDIPKSGSVDFYLRLFNAKHPLTLAKNFTLTVAALTKSWEEGNGLDMESYTDLTYDQVGSNWGNAGSASQWETLGGDYVTNNGNSLYGYTRPGNRPLDFSSSFTASFASGVEDMEINITSLAEQWINSQGNVLGSKSNYGVIVALTSSQEGYFSGSVTAAQYPGYHVVSGTAYFHHINGAKKSYYTKKFFARGSEFYYKRPMIEARWDSSNKDNRGCFYISSSIASANDNLNTLYMYNYVRGQLKDIPGLTATADGKEKLYVRIYSSSSLGTNRAKTLPIDGKGGVTANGHTVITGSRVAKGIYSASFAYTGSDPEIYDVWFTESAPSFNAFGGTYTEYHTGSAIFVKSFTGSIPNYNPQPTHVTTVKDLRATYGNTETARFRLFTREKNWNPTIYSKATADIKSEIIEDCYYSIYRVSDNTDVIRYGTGSMNHTRLSYDVSGNYFDLDMSLLERDYAYGVKFVFYINGKYVEQNETFKFRVE
jgi:hypothetical protein